MARLSFILSLILVISSCNLVGQNRKPAQAYVETDESLVKVQFPLQTIRGQIEDLLKDNKFIERINYFEMDSITRILQVGLRVRYPLNALFNEEMRAPREIDEVHDIEFSISFPKAKSLSMSRYLSLTFEKFNIDGKSYLNHFEVVFAVIKTVLVNTPLINYVESSLSQNLEDQNTRNLLKEILETNKLIFNPTLRRISLKLDFSMIDSLKDFSNLEDLRLWQCSPFLFKGTKDIFFRVEAGLGKPSSVWIDEYNNRVNEDTRTILQVRDQLYREFSNLNTIKSVLFHYLNENLGKESINPERLPKIYQNDLEKFTQNLYEDLSQALSMSNDNFIADPEYEYIQLLNYKKNQIRNYVSHLDRRLSIDYNILHSGSRTNKTRPLLTKRISQDAINAGFNFLKDLDYEGYRYMKESYLMIAPNLPGVIFKGKLNVEKNNLLGLIDKKLIDKNVQLPFVEADEGIPFEVVAEVSFEDKGFLGIDAKSISLFEGSKKLQFNRNEKNSAFILDLVKILLADSMSSLSYDLSEDNDAQDNRVRDMLNYLKELKELYEPGSSNQIFENITKSLEVDIKKNPFSTSGSEFVEKKAEILYGHIFKYDEKDKIFKIHLDPAIIANDIQGVQHNLQVWNVSPVMSKELNNTFLEIAVGQGIRPQSYVEELYYRQNNIDNADFSGIYNDLNRSKVDLMVTLNFDYLEIAANNFLKEMSEAQTKDEHGNIENKLEVDTEQEYNIIDHVTTNINSRNEIELELHATRIKKEKKGFIWKKWKITRDPVSIKAILDIKSKSLKDVKPYLKDHYEPLYLTDEVLTLSPSRVQIKMGRPSLVNSILNKIAKVNFNSGLGSLVKKILLKLVHNYFNKTYKKKESNKPYGHPINESLRVMSTNNEIVVFLSPRMAGAAFELKLTGKDGFINESVIFDQKNQELNLAFSAAAQVAKFDKQELLKIAIDTENMISPYLKARNKSQLKRLLKDEPLLINKLIIDTDASKKSLYKRLLDQMVMYDQILTLVDVPFRAKNDERKISTNASEIMYFAASAYILYNRVYKLSKKISDYGLQAEAHNYESLLEARKKLYHNIFKPLMIKYRDEYHMRNKNIKEAEISYWNASFYPDAFFSEAVFMQLLKEGIR
jgi:hypothetical protein